MTAERRAAPLRFGQQSAPDPAAPQIAVHPEQIDKQPASIDMADHPGPDRAATPTGIPLQQQTLTNLMDAGFDPAVLDALEVAGTWA